jgi:hypothetical protein
MGWGARSVRQRLGLQRGPVGVERWQRLKHEPKCVCFRLRRPQLPSCVHPSRGKSLSTPPTGIQSPSRRALHRGGAGAGGRLASAGVRLLVPPWGSNPRPQDLAAALPRACGCAAPQGVRGAWGACAQCSSAPPARASASTARSARSATTAQGRATRAASRAPEPVQAGDCASTCIASTPPAYTRTTVSPGCLIKLHPRKTRVSITLGHAISSGHAISCGCTT